jgi:hypothetical protein
MTEDEIRALFAMIAVSNELSVDDKAHISLLMRFLMAVSRLLMGW